MVAVAAVALLDESTAKLRLRLLSGPPDEAKAKLRLRLLSGLLDEAKAKLHLRLLPPAFSHAAEWALPARGFSTAAKLLGVLSASPRRRG